MENQRATPRLSSGATLSKQRYIDIARRLGALGAHLVLTRDKVAIHRGWQESGAGLEELERWVQSTPDLTESTGRHLYGVLPASLGCLVVDVDQGDAQAVRAFLGAVPLGVTKTVRGIHLWYRWSGEERGNGSWELSGRGEKGDIRHRRGYVVLHPYDGLEGLLMALEGGGMGNELSGRRLDELLGMVPEPSRGGSNTTPMAELGASAEPISGRPKGGVRLVREAREGERNNVLNLSVFMDAKEGRLTDKQKSKYIEAGVGVGLPLTEVMATIASAEVAGERERERKALELEELKERRSEERGTRLKLCRERKAEKVKERKAAERASVLEGRELLEEESPYDRFARALEVAGVKLRKNELSEMIEICFDGGVWKNLRDEDENYVRQLFYERCAVRSKDEVVPFRMSKTAYEEVAGAYIRAHQVDVFRDWLEGLSLGSAQDTDQDTDQDTEDTEDTDLELDTWLTEVLGAEDNAQTRWVARYIITGVVKRALEPGAKADIMPVLISDQGIGKSTALSKLIPEDLGAELFSDRLFFGMSTKCAMESVGSAAIVEVSEMTGIRRAEIEAMKGFVTSRVDRYRAAYARHASHKPRRFIMVGTTNSDRCLPSDETGNRRFMPIKCHASSDAPDVARRLAWLERNRKKIWSQALELVRCGKEELTPPESLRAAREAAAEDARYADEALEAAVLEAVKGEGDNTTNGEELVLREMVTAPEVTSYLFGMVTDMGGRQRRRFPEFGEGIRHQIYAELRRLGYRRASKRINKVKVRCWVRKPSAKIGPDAFDVLTFEKK